MYKNSQPWPPAYMSASLTAILLASILMSFGQTHSNENSLSFRQVSSRSAHRSPAALTFTAGQQDSSSTGQAPAAGSEAKSAVHGHKVKGCIRTEGGKYLLEDGHGRMYSLNTTEDLSAHVGHEVVIHGTVSGNGSSMNKSDMSKSDTSNSSMSSSAAGGNKEIAVTKVDMVSETCKLHWSKAAKGDSPVSSKDGAEAKSDNYSVVKVFYATDRKKTSSEPLEFGSDRDDGPLHFGAFKVSIPRDHHLADIERPSIWHFEFREDATKHFIIVERTAKTEGNFYKEVVDTVAHCPEKQAFVFIHGFDVGFEDAIYRTAQIAYDLGFCGAPILYSWPSNGSKIAYTWDLTVSDWTVPHLQAFLDGVSKRTGAKTIHLIAHSMGNRALVNALSHFNGPAPHFHQIVLTAPDIDAPTFIQLADAVRSHADRVTLYVSSNDRALKLSRRINGSRRAGDSDGDVIVMNGLDTIDVSGVDTDLAGHFYYGDNRSFLSDLFHLLQTGDPPDRRFGIHETGIPPKKYWRFVP